MTENVLVWIETHPVAMAVIVWPLITGIATFLFKPRSAEQYEALARVSVRLAGFLRLTGSIGLDVPNLVKGLRTMVTGKVPPPPPPGKIGVMRSDRPPANFDDYPTMPTTHAIPPPRGPDTHELQSAPDYDGHQTWPPPPAVAVLALVLFFTGCHPSESAAANATKAGNYGAELQACVVAAQTKAESQACRCDVNKRWARPCTPDVDGGAP